jgi:hypothetical protein
MAHRPPVLAPVPAPVLLLALGAALLAAPTPPDARARGFDFEKGFVSRWGASADLDGDGAADLVVAQTYLDFGTQHGRVVAFLGDPAVPARWRQRVETEVGANPRDILVADLDGNGRLDIATASPFEGTATVLLQSLAGTFSRADYEAVPGALGIAAGDLNRDGLPDLALAGASKAVVLLQDPGVPGTFLAPSTIATGLEPTCIAVADMDGANGGDVVVGQYDSFVICLQDAAAAGTFPVSTPVDAPGAAIKRMVAADIDGNGRADIACAMKGLPLGGGKAGIGLLLQDPAGGLVFSSKDIDPFQPLRTIEIKDMDVDGVPDLLTAGGGRIVWYRQDPAARGTFKRGGQREGNASDGAIAGGDFDGDGFPDAGVAYHHAILLLQNPDSGKFRQPHRYRTSQ